MIIIKSKGCGIDFIKVKDNYSYLKDVLFLFIIYLL